MAKTPAPEAPQPERPTLGKGHATPSRADQVAARKRPLVPDTKEAKQAARARVMQQRDRARVGMENGEEKYLLARDRGPQRRFVRNWVDARWNLGELVVPALVVLVVSTFVPAILLYAYVVMWVLLLVVGVDMVFTARGAKKAARAEFGADRLERGLGWYGAMRSIQLRALRRPKPQVTRRGEPITAARPGRG